MTRPWLELCRDSATDIRGVLAGMPSSREREPVVGTGLGGDETIAVDAAAEAAVVARLERLERGGLGFTLVSEELGERAFGGGGAPWVVLDPIDGSLNAKRGIPSFALSVAVATGPTLGEVAFGYVYDFGTGEEWTAVLGEGARRNGEPLGDERPREQIEVLALEATLTSLIAEKAPAVVGLAHRLRIQGSLAIALCHLAAGRIDAVCSLKPARAVDIAAAALVLREQGLAIELPEAAPFDAAPLDTIGRSRVVAGASAEVCARLGAAIAG